MTADRYRPSLLAYCLPLCLAMLAIWGDALSTRIALQNPNAVEGDPVAAWLFARIGIMPTAAAMCGMLLLCAVVGWRSTRRNMASLLVVIFWLAFVIRVPVILNNLQNATLGWV